MRWVLGRAAPGAIATGIMAATSISTTTIILTEIITSTVVKAATAARAAVSGNTIQVIVEMRLTVIAELPISSVAADRVA